MIILPAIDLKGGHCVRLVEGKLGTERVVAEDPVTQARAFAEAGAQRIHVVDLDGAFTGRPAHTDVIARMAKAVDVPIQIGGGLRTREDVDAVLQAGASFAILGTMAVKNPNLLAEICARYPGAIIAGIDAARGDVKTEGWVESGGTTVLELGKTVAKMGAAAVVTTDITRDGTGLGVNVEDTDRLARALPIPVVASGGVAGIEDVRALAKTSVFGVVIGRALYDGALDLHEALTVARGA